jgi:hypothetical protein
MAQDLDMPKGAWWREPSVVKTLSLTENEVEQLEAAFVDWHLNEGQLKGHILYNQRKIDSWKARKSSNPQGKEKIIQELKDKIEIDRALLPKAKPAYVDKVRAILGSARYEKLLTLKP